jgi:N-glycosylase/DNA lyase
MRIKGVGEKIADCVLLYAYGRYEVFPTDVWVKRIIEHYYFDDLQKMDKIQEFAKYYFGSYAGFAQQYLFYYARDNKIGK